MGHQDQAAYQMHESSTNYSEATRNFARSSSRPIPARRGHASCEHSAMEGIDEVVGNPDLTDTPPLSTAADSVEQPAGYFGESSTFNFVLKMGARGADHTQQDLARRRLSTGGSEATFSALGHSPPERRDFSILPPKQLADSLIDAYFLHVHRLYPFVHEPSFRSKYDHMWVQASNEHVEPEPRWMGLLNIVFAHGCEFCDSLPQEGSPAVASEFLNRTRKIVYAHVFREGSLELIQALLLMSHYLQGTMELNECWSLVGLMIRTSVSLGFHMNPPESVHSVVEQEMRKRVWWGCYIIDRTLSMKFGRPISTQGAHLYTVDLPLEVDDQYITESSAQPRQPEGRPSLIVFFIQTIKQQSVIENILSNLYNGCPSSTPNVKPLRSLGQLVVLDDELLSWWDNLPAHLKCEPDLPDGPDFRRQRNVIYIRQGYPDSFLLQFPPTVLMFPSRYLNTRLLLHRHAFLIFCRQRVEDEFHQAVAVASSRCCIAAARDTIKTIHREYSRRLLNSLWYSLHYVFTAMGVLLALQAMDRTRLELLGDTYQDDTLEMGMSFLRAASSKSNLAARYVDLLQRIRKRPNDQYSIHAAPRDNLITIQDGIDTDPSLPALPEGDLWLDRGQNELGSSLNLDFLDFDDLLYGTGLPRDLLGQDWSGFET
ncbi:hypothetical protein LTR67_007010 [Exophiala xenobiotica]